MGKLTKSPSKMNPSPIDAKNGSWPLVREIMPEFAAETGLSPARKSPRRYLWIENFWLEPKSRESETWTAHHDINRVMLATSLAPDGFLKI
jgi:hypothetical protein